MKDVESTMEAAMIRLALLLVGLVVATLPLAAFQGTRRFEVASVKRSLGIIGPMDIGFFPNRFVATRLTLGQLVQQAYGIQAYKLIGGPDWVRVERFDVTATPAMEVRLDDMKLMLQTLLADRFQLRVHRATRSGTVYRLITRNVRNLNPPAQPDERSLVQTHNNGKDGFLSYTYVGVNGTMEQLAAVLGDQLRAPVIDETKLAGKYDFRVSWTLDEPFFGALPDPNTPTIFTALERDLGLKLETSRGPVPVLVIDSAERPTPN
jgi:uncharacterized protein (TIGR03435 family)